jgi:hypothetical protein
LGDGGEMVVEMVEMVEVVEMVVEMVGRREMVVGRMNNAYWLPGASVLSRKLK